MTASSSHALGAGGSFRGAANTTTATSQSGAQPNGHLGPVATATSKMGGLQQQNHGAGAQPPANEYRGRGTDNTPEWLHYLRVNSAMPDSYVDYKQTKIRWRNHSEYRLIKHIGRGKYSEVFVGKKRAIIDHVGENAIESKEEFRVVKVLRPIRYEKLLREVKILNDLRGHDNIVTLLDVVQDKASGTHAFVFEYMQHDDHRKIFSKFTIYDSQHYVYQILLGLDFIHSRGIMHRDIKPHNIIYNINARTLKIIDFGLAEYYIENQDYVVRVASKCFKGPELLLRNQKYDYSLDIWGLGCVFASILFMKEPFFLGENNEDMVVKITQVLGYPELDACIKKYNIKYEESELAKMRGFRSQRWEPYYQTKYIERITPDSLNLLDSLLVIDHRCRISARQAIRHPYFLSVRCIYGDSNT